LELNDRVVPHVQHLELEKQHKKEINLTAVSHVDVREGMRERGKQKGTSEIE